MMKYLALIVAALMAACSIPPASFKSDSSPIDVVANDAPKVEGAKEPEARTEPKIEPKPKAVIKIPACKGIDTGDAKESLNLKLDCMLDGK
jgi:hypothetical protein